MYCIKCGIELANGSSVCPVCETRVCHPDFPADDGLAPYPKTDFESEAVSRKGLLFVITVLLLLALTIPMTVEITVFGRVSWSSYVAGGIILGYLFAILPLWFAQPNPVVFLPIDFASSTLFLLYINFKTDGDWFLTFAFPIAAALCIIFTAVVALFRYVRRGRLYMLGGTLISLGALMLLIEFLMSLTFERISVSLWSIYPCVSLSVLGIMLIIIAIVKPFKDSLAKMFFV
ncbi:MAG: hypothetical protein IKU61_06945 [Clostridia bacterium]|nr:hypothetical protein [Clostridia bacterium]